jgi:exodeoxyribonuclease VII large subunit
LFPEVNKVLTLSELTTGIAQVISRNFANSFWVKAEIAKLNHYPESGHCYPALVEKEKGAVRAEMRGMIWANDYLRINQKFLQVTREPLKEGIHILFRALIKYHPVYGLSLQISDIDPTYTLGEMAREKMETINRLKKEGVFDLNRQLSLPALPQRIAIISVKTSKGFSDFMSILQGNQWGYAFACYLFPALLQGDKAVDSILGQLKAIKEISDHIDAVVIIRGGGGDVGLNCYDHYNLAKEVAMFPIPVLTGIGHSTNETVVEMVSGQNLITPTDVAYFLIQKFHNFSIKLEQLAGVITDYALGLLEEETRRQGDLGKRLVQGTRLMMEEEKRRQGDKGRRLMQDAGSMLKDEKYKISRQSAMMGVHVRQMILKQGMRIDQAEQQVRLLDPVNVLKRGYSITYSKGKVLKDAAEAILGDEIITQLHQGTVCSEIKSKST